MGQLFTSLCRRCEKPKRNDGVYVTASDATETDPDDKLMRAICDFDANCTGDLSFQRGETLEVISRDDEFWWKVRKIDTGVVGYVARHYLQAAGSNETAYIDCWFDVDRLEAERLLRMPGLEDGTYLLRPHHQEQPLSSATFTLSVRCAKVDDNGITGFIIRHYRVLSLEDGGGFYINPNRTFASLDELLRHYQASGAERHMCLTRPCPRVFTPPPNFRDFEISRDQLDLIERIGCGSFGEVWKARFGPVLEVAVKRMAQESVTVSNDFIQEARLMHRLHHPKIVQLIGVCTITEPVYIVTEYMPLGSLHSFLFEDRSVKRITFVDMLNYLHQIADGMNYLEEQKYIHCDLRAANILVSSHQLVKVADFGLAKLVESGYYRRKGAFPLRWSAPECIAKKKFSIKSDVWSYGVVIFEVATRGEKPYKYWSNKEVEENVLSGRRMRNTLTDHGIERTMADRLYQCMLECWSKSRKLRPTFRRLKELFEDFAIEGDDGYVELER